MLRREIYHKSIRRRTKETGLAYFKTEPLSGSDFFFEKFYLENVVFAHSPIQNKVSQSIINFSSRKTRLNQD